MLWIVPPLDSEALRWATMVLNKAGAALQFPLTTRMQIIQTDNPDWRLLIQDSNDPVLLTVDEEINGNNRIVRGPTFGECNTSEGKAALWRAIKECVSLVTTDEYDDSAAREIIQGVSGQMDRYTRAGQNVQSHNILFGDCMLAFGALIPDTGLPVLDADFIKQLNILIKTGEVEKMAINEDDAQLHWRYRKDA